MFTKQLQGLLLHAKKTDVTLILSIIAKEKSDWIAKSEKLFWLLTTLIVIIA